jgi:hypothetical protein
MMNWKGYERKRSCPNFRYCTGIFLEGLPKTTKNFSQDRQSLDRDLNPEPPEYTKQEYLPLDHDVLSNRLKFTVEMSRHAVPLLKL